ncbi:MAG: cupin domain-containing protein [Acidobacteria bacterium]|nr:cupin domain-containing protein [Acidobacteriota bacterium]
MRRTFLMPLTVMVVLAAFHPPAEPFFIQRHLADLEVRPDDLTSGARGAIYQPIFGIGAPDSERLRGVARCGLLTVGPGGSSVVVPYPAEEQIYYILEGGGTLVYEDRRVPVQKDDFMYLPVRSRHGMANESDAPVRVIVMGFRIPAGQRAAGALELQLANAAEVPLQALSSHGPTTQFRLLMGQTMSRRDKLAAACQMTSLFIMDFAAGGNNNPHSHAAEEEIYLLMRGSGEIVAGKTADGQDARHPVKEGAVFFFGPGTRVGYYSGAKEGQEHDLILAARSRLE